jgi:hypothetical protein
MYDERLIEKMDPICPECKNGIDVELCHCGSLIKDHTYYDGHSPVPVGCTCGYPEEAQA